MLPSIGQVLSLNLEVSIIVDTQFILHFAHSFFIRLVPIFSPGWFLDQIGRAQKTDGAFFFFYRN
jgi:hypothetical protein